MNLSKSRVQEVSQEDASRERGEQAGAIAGRAASAEKGGLFSRFFGLR
jgi:predicted transposase YdaD